MIRGEVCGNLNSTSRNSSKLKIFQIKWLTCWKDGSTFDRNVCGIMMWNKYLSRVKILINTLMIYQSVLVKAS